MKCDIIGLQEISFSTYNQLNDLENGVFDSTDKDIENIQYSQYVCKSQININILKAINVIK